MSRRPLRIPPPEPAEGLAERVLLLALHDALPADSDAFAETVARLHETFGMDVRAMGLSEAVRIYCENDRKLQLIGALIPEVKEAVSLVLDGEDIPDDED